MPQPPSLGFLRASLTILTAALFAACGSSSGEIEKPPVVPGADGGPDVAAPYDGPIPDDGGVIPDVAVGGEAGPPPGRDASGDRKVGGTPEERYAGFRADRDGLLVQRLAECFNADPAAPAPVVADDSNVDLSLRFGLVTFDDPAADACLQAIGGETCDALAANAHDSACAKVLQGQLATSGYCRIDEDCKDPDKTFCKVGPATICMTRCLPRTANGERCMNGSECLPGSSCRPGPDGMTTVCLVRMNDGEACDSDECQPGMYCRAGGPDSPDGTCSAIKAGGPCSGTWQCPPYHACVLSAALTGACGPGRKAGEACQIHVPDQPTISDCAYGLGCYPDLASGQLRCSAGRKLDEACTDHLPCRVGQCVAGKCAALRKQGESCTDEISCEDGQACVEGKCAPELLPSGSRCGGTEQRPCVTGTICKPEGDGGAGSPGTCVPARKPNETCDPGQCEPALDCVGGVCRRCN